jgi:hypothetical protein
VLINQSANAKGILTGKFFEYLAAMRPILGIGPTDGDAASVLKETGAGKMVDFEDGLATKKIILEFYNQYKAQTLGVKSNHVKQFSRRELTGKLAKILNELG